MKSKLEKLFDDESFARDSIRNDNGIMINDEGDMVDYLVLEYPDHFDVYLNLTDDGESPYRDILVKGSSKNRDVAKKIATRKLNKECGNLTH